MFDSPDMAWIAENIVSLMVFQTTQPHNWMEDSKNLIME